MKKNFLKYLVATVMAIFGVTAPMMAPAFAEEDEEKSNGGNSFSKICENEELAENCEPVKDNRNLITVVQNIINVVLSLVGIIAVIVIVVAGQRMATSAGDPGKLKAAKDMLTGGIIGMIVALLAFAVVNLIVTIVPGG